MTDMSSSESSDATAGQGSRRLVHIVPHTHWDREWYSSFQTFRLRLVDLLDDLLPPDGGRPVLRPLPARRPAGRRRRLPRRAARARPSALRRLVGSGRMAVGPWYTLPDEFLVSGETLVRNLQLGLRAGDRFGGAMAGRLPARHVRPRGPDAPDPAPGSGSSTRSCGGACPPPSTAAGSGGRRPTAPTVRAEYMPEGYGNGSALPDDAKALRRAQVAGFADELGATCVDRTRSCG